jgi:3-hydroxyisobutyrate dehydrogenase
MTKIGFIGLGVMGMRMATRLVKSGFDLVVYDIDKAPMRALSKAGAGTGKSVQAVAETSTCLITMLPSPAATREVIIGKNGAIFGLRPGSVFIDMSTSNPMLTKELAKRLRPKKIRMLDAPVSGGMEGAEKGTLSIMVGGEKSVLRRVEDIFKSLGTNVYHVGPVGAGHTIKLINNMLFALIMAATAEAFAFGRKSGIDPGTLREVINSSTGRSFVSDVKLRDFVIPNNFSPGFAVDLQIKDLDLALQLGKDLGIPLVLGSVVRQAYQTLLVKGYGRKDTSIITSFFNDIMGIK